MSPDATAKPSAVARSRSNAFHSANAMVPRNIATL